MSNSGDTIDANSQTGCMLLVTGVELAWQRSAEAMHQYVQPVVCLVVFFATIFFLEIVPLSRTAKRHACLAAGSCIA